MGKWGLLVSFLVPLPKISLALQHVALFVKRVFEDAIKSLEVETASWIISVGLKLDDKCPYKRHAGDI